jgi:hypothetical protein
LVKSWRSAGVRTLERAPEKHPAGGLAVERGGRPPLMLNTDGREVKGLRIWIVAKCDIGMRYHSDISCDIFFIA